MRSIVSLRSFVFLCIGCQLAVVAGGYAYWRSNARSGSISGVAIVDLDEVAKQLGKDTVLVKQIKDAETSLNEQLGSLQRTLKEQYRQKQQEMEQQQQASRIGNPEDSPKKQEVAEYGRKLDLQLLQAQQDARKRLSVYQLQLIQKFRSEVIPVAQAIAAQRGLGVVIIKNDAVLLTFDNTHDITSTVVKMLREQKTTGDTQQPSQTARSNQGGTQLR